MPRRQKRTSVRPLSVPDLTPKDALRLLKSQKRSVLSWEAPNGLHWCRLPGCPVHSPRKTVSPSPSQTQVGQRREVLRACEMSEALCRSEVRSWRLTEVSWPCRSSVPIPPIPTRATRPPDASSWMQQALTKAPKYLDLRITQSHAPGSSIEHRHGRLEIYRHTFWPSKTSTFCSTSFQVILLRPSRASSSPKV